VRPLKPLKTLSRRTILDHGPRLKVEDHEVELPDGRVVKDWPWVITRDYVIVLTLSVEGRFIHFLQTK